MIEFAKNALLVLLGGFGAGSGGFWTYLRGRKTQRAATTIDAGKLELAGRRVESEAYQQAAQMNRDVVSGLHEEIDRLRSDLRDERNGRAADKIEHDSEIAELRALIGQLRTELDVTRRQLRIIPPATEGTGENDA